MGIDRDVRPFLGPNSRGVHQLWFADGQYVHMSSGAPDFVPSHPKDDQFYRIIDVKNPTNPVEVGRWWLPGTKEGDSEPPPERHPENADTGFRPHNTNVYPERPDRAYLGYIDGGLVILDIADMAHPKMVARWDYHPPYFGFTHTVVPFFDRNLLIVSDECTRTEGTDWPKLVWVVDPNSRVVQIHRPASSPGGRLSGAAATDIISGEGIIPGFSCPVAEFFESGKA